MGDEDGEKKKRCTCCAKGSTFSMVVFIFFEVCCFQLCQVRQSHARDADRTIELTKLDARRLPQQHWLWRSSEHKISRTCTLLLRLRMSSRSRS
jgi:hypothetical protein